MVLAPPTHKAEATGDAALDRIQNNVRQVVQYLKDTFWLTRRAYVALATDVTISPAAYATLLTANLTTAADQSFLLIQFTASTVHTTTAATIFFQIVVDGVVRKGAYITFTATAAGLNACMLVRVPVVKGAHVVQLQWKTDGGVARVLAASTNEEHANLHVQEEAA